MATDASRPISQKALEAGYTLDEALAAGLENRCIQQWCGDASPNGASGMPTATISTDTGIPAVLPSRSSYLPQRPVTRVDLSAKGTANCYIVEPGTAGSFDATHKGNSR